MMHWRLAILLVLLTATLAYGGQGLSPSPGPYTGVVTATGTSAPRPLGDQLADTISVKQFGATGINSSAMTSCGTYNTVTVDYCGIQTAIDFVRVNATTQGGIGITGRRIYIPAGIYNMGGNTLMAYSMSLGLYGEGPLSTILNWNQPNVNGLMFSPSNPSQGTLGGGILQVSNLAMNNLSANNGGGGVAITAQFALAVPSTLTLEHLQLGYSAKGFWTQSAVITSASYLTMNDIVTQGQLTTSTGAPASTTAFEFRAPPPPPPPNTPLNPGLGHYSYNINNVHVNLTATCFLFHNDSYPGFQGMLFTNDTCVNVSGDMFDVLGQTPRVVPYWVFTNDQYQGDGWFLNAQKVANVFAQNNASFVGSVLLPSGQGAAYVPGSLTSPPQIQAGNGGSGYNSTDVLTFACGGLGYGTPPTLSAMVLSGGVIQSVWVVTPGNCVSPQMGNVNLSQAQGSSGTSNNAVATITAANYQVLMGGGFYLSQDANTEVIGNSVSPVGTDVQTVVGLSSDGINGQAYAGQISNAYGSPMVPPVTALGYVLRTDTSTATNWYIDPGNFYGGKVAAAITAPTGFIGTTGNTYNSVPTGVNSAVLCGAYCQTTGANTTVLGVQSCDRGRTGSLVWAAGIIATPCDAQIISQLLKKTGNQLGSPAGLRLTSDAGVPSTVNELNIPSNTVDEFSLKVSCIDRMTPGSFYS